MHPFFFYLTLSFSSTPLSSFLLHYEGLNDYPGDAGNEVAETFSTSWGRRRKGNQDLYLVGRGRVKYANSQVNNFCSSALRIRLYIIAPGRSLYLVFIKGWVGQVSYFVQTLPTYYPCFYLCPSSRALGPGSSLILGWLTFNSFEWLL